jgi:hypothetical protein
LVDRRDGRRCGPGLFAYLAFRIPAGSATIRAANEVSGDFTTDLNWFWAGAAAAVISVLVIALAWRFSDWFSDRLWTLRWTRVLKRAVRERRWKPSGIAASACRSSAGALLESVLSRSWW